MKRQLRIWGSRTFVAVLLVVGVQQWGVPLYRQYFTEKTTEAFVPTAKVRSGPFVVSFHEIGTLQAERSVPVTAGIGGKIIAMVSDGRQITTGDQIALFDTTELDREVRSKQLAHQNTLADVKRAEAELEILLESNRTEVEQAEAQLRYDENELERAKKELEKQQKLADEKLVPRSKVDDADLAVTSKQFAVEKGSKDLALKKKEVESKQKQKESDVENVRYKERMARLELEDAQGRVKNSLLRAPASGLVVISKDWTPDGRRKLKAGDSVHPRQTICEIPDLTSMQVKVQVGESDAPRIRVGVPTLVRLEAVPQRVFHGTVEDISSLATEGSPWDSSTIPGRKNFEVTIKVKEVEPKTLKPGMTADVEFLIDTVNKTLYIPLEAVNERSGKTFAFVKSAGRFSRRDIATGRNNDNFICVTNGLKSGELVALRDPTRPLDQQEAGASTPEEEENGGSKTVPIPGGE